MVGDKDQGLLDRTGEEAMVDAAGTDRASDDRNTSPKSRAALLLRPQSLTFEFDYHRKLGIHF